MERMNDARTYQSAEARALDDEISRADLTLGPNGTGFLSQREARLMGYDALTMNYLGNENEAEHKTPAQIVGEMVREKIAVSA
ncbi:hypothetical protein [Treponema primitia]|uniref:hypothetical protein n=1 Tax=Treponema primitia TaxID=88058 RepID=UPI0002555189|nr:hypothetical protein [Treponema primitia]